MKVFILLSVVAVALASQCGENQHYTNCGTACPLTCENYKNPPKFCIPRCDIGCECDKGFVKTSDGQCVKPEECPAKAGQCGENQHYTNCGTACPLTCENYKNPPKFCILRCDIGCECDKGFVKTSDGRCVKPEECPAKAGQKTKTCLEKADSGMCEAYMPMWYYDVEAGICKRFIYGGCQGNTNRYATEEECMQNCRNVVSRQASSEVCELPKESGVCDAYMPRYYFDVSRGECRIFIYGGCGGNGNNFRTIEECRKACDEA